MAYDAAKNKTLQQKSFFSCNNDLP